MIAVTLDVQDRLVRNMVRGLIMRIIRLEYDIRGADLNRTLGLKQDIAMLSDFLTAVRERETCVNYAIGETRNLIARRGYRLG
jgi:hypothetical protein